MLLLITGVGWRFLRVIRSRRVSIHLMKFIMRQECMEVGEYGCMISMYPLPSQGVDVGPENAADQVTISRGCGASTPFPSDFTHDFTSGKVALSGRGCS